MESLPIGNFLAKMKKLLFQKSEPEDVEESYLPNKAAAVDT